MLAASGMDEGLGLGCAAILHRNAPVTPFSHSSPVTVLSVGDDAGVSGQRAAAFAASLSTLYLQDDLLPDQQSAFKHLSPKGLFVSFIRQSVLVLGARMQVVTKCIDELEEDEEDEIQLSDIFSPTKSQHELSVWKNFLPSLKIGMVREALVTSFQRAYELIAIQTLKKELASRLVKDVAKSSMRKAMRFSGQRMVLSVKVARTALLGNVTFYLASFTVSQFLDTWETMRSSAAATRRPEDAIARQQATARRSGYLRRLVNNAFKCTGMCVFAAIGASVGTHVKPGLGTTVGVIFAPNIFLLLC